MHCGQPHRLVAEVVDLAGELDVAAADGGEVLAEPLVEPRRPLRALPLLLGVPRRVRREPGRDLRVGLGARVAEGQAWNVETIPVSEGDPNQISHRYFA